MIQLRSYSLIFRRFLTTAKYHDITTYLKYAKSNHISVQSTVFQGSIFEIYTKKMLENIFNASQVKIVGGSGDGGIDLICDWDLYQYIKDGSESNNQNASNSNSGLMEIYKMHSIKPLFQKENLKIPKRFNKSHPVKMIVQCKSTKKKIGSRLIRELIGTYSIATANGDSHNTFLMIASTSILSEAALEVFNQTQIPIIYVQLSMPSIFDSLKNIDGMFQSTPKYYKPANYEKGGIILSYLRNNFCSLLLKGLDDYNVINEKIINQRQLYSK